MHTRDPIEELDKAADEILSKSEKTEELKADDISEEADETEEEEDADGGAEESEDAADDDSDDVDDDDADDEDGDMEKSVETDVIGADDVSETASAMVEILAKSLADVMENITETKEASDNTSAVLAKSLLAQNMILNEQKTDLVKTNRELSALSKSLAKRLDAIDQKLDSLSAQPAHMRKSVGSYAVTDRNFKGSLDGTGGDMQPLSKSEAIGILTNELMNGSGGVTAQDIVQLESGGTVREEIRALLNSKRAR